MGSTPYEFSKKDATVLGEFLASQFTTTSAGELVLAAAGKKAVETELRRHLGRNTLRENLRFTAYFAARLESDHGFVQASRSLIAIVSALAPQLGNVSNSADGLEPKRRLNRFV